MNRWCRAAAKVQLQLSWCSSADVQQCRCAEVQVQRRCKVGAEVVQRWCRGAGPEVVQRWCKGDAEGGAEKVQRQRSRGSKVLRF